MDSFGKKTGQKMRKSSLIFSIVVYVDYAAKENKSGGISGRGTVMRHQPAWPHLTRLVIPKEFPVLSLEAGQDEKNVTLEAIRINNYSYYHNMFQYMEAVRQYETPKITEEGRYPSRENVDEPLRLAIKVGILPPP